MMYWARSGSGCALQFAAIEPRATAAGFDAAVGRCEAQATRLALPRRITTWRWIASITVLPRAAECSSPTRQIAMRRAFSPGRCSRHPGRATPGSARGQQRLQVGRERVGAAAVAHEQAQPAGRVEHVRTGGVDHGVAAFRAARHPGGEYL